jgi:CRP-like cAMP-binding protein
MDDWTVLAGLAPSERKEFVAAARRRTFRRGEIIFHEGDPADTVHLLTEGRVAVRVTTPLGDVAILTVLGPGQVFGELALLADTARTATIVALQRCETLALHRDEFQRLRAASPTVDQFLTAALVQQVARLSALLLDAHFVPAPARVARRLLDLCDEFGDRRPGTVVPITQEDLAQMAGTTRSTANQVLHRIEEAGAIRVRRGKIEILDPAALRRQAR